MPISVASPRSAPRLAPPLRALVRAALAAERRRPGEIAIVLTDDAALRALNRQWRRIDRATDVIAFAYDERDPSPLTGASQVNGDVVISLDRVRAQARRFRVTEGCELARLAIHGALHLAGLDHHRKAERLVMRAREDAVLAACRTPVRELERAMTRPKRGGMK